MTIQITPDNMRWILYIDLVWKKWGFKVWRRPDSFGPLWAVYCGPIQVRFN